MNRPWISCNLAISADGKISSPGHRPSNWTSEADLQRLKALRQPADAILVGRGTAETDRMTMSVEGKSPLRCIVSRHGDLSSDHPVFNTDGGDIHLLATKGYRGAQRAGVTPHETSLSSFLTVLRAEHGVDHLHCEGGGQLIRELAELDLIDEFHLTLAGHTLLGGALSPTATAKLGQFLPHALDFSLEHFQPDSQSGECFLSYRRRRNQ